MAIYRSVQLSFWTDNKVVDDFTPEDKYFYLYLFTNPQTNLCGCYEVSISTMANQLGYNKESVERLMERFENYHKVICYSRKTKELLLLNWSKYNWHGGGQKVCIEREIGEIKNSDFKQYLANLFTEKFIGEDTPIGGSIDPLGGTVTDTVINILDKSNSNNNKTIKHIYGEYKHVRLTDEQYEKLLTDFGQGKLDKCIQILDEYIETSGRSYKNHNLVLRGWVQNEFKRRYPCFEQVESKPELSADEIRKRVMGEI